MGIQILPPRESGFERAFQASRPALKTISDLIGKHKEKKQGSEFGKRLATEFNRPELEEVIKMTPREKWPEIYKSLIAQKGMADLNKFLIKEAQSQNMDGSAQQDMEAPQRQEEAISQAQQQQGMQQRPGMAKRNPYETALAIAAAGHPEIAKAFLEGPKAEERKVEAIQKEKQFAHKETEKFANETVDSSKNAEEIKFASNVVRNAIRSGKTGATAQNMAYAYLSDAKSPLAGMFQSKEAGKFNVAMKTLASGFKKIMGSKPTEREFFWYENILPGLLKGAPTNEAILDYFDHLADLDIKTQEIADRIVSENGGYRPIDIGERVRKEMKPYLNEAINEGYALSGEFETSNKKGDKKESQKTIFTDRPPAKSNKGAVLTNEDTGERFKSDGNEWVPIND